MRRILQLFILILAICCHVNATDMNLQIQAPDMKLLLPPVGPPQLMKEGEPLFEEKQIIGEYFKFIDRKEYEEALAYLREKTGSVLESIESGDSDGRLKQRTIAGSQLAVDAGGIPTPGEPGTGYISPYFLYLIGQTYFLVGDYKAAETAFLTVLTPMPDFVRVHESLGLLYMRLERFEDAHKHLVHAAGLGLHTSQLFGMLGYLNYKTGNYWGAVKAFQEVLMLKPDDEQWERGLLYSLSRTYEHQSAFILAESMLKKHPDDAGLWLFKAMAALQAGDREVTLSSLETAIRLGDHQASNLQACAVLHMELGSVKRAINLLKSGFTEDMDFVYNDQCMNWLKQAEEWALLEQMLNSLRRKWDSLDELQQSRVLMREADISLHKGKKSSAGDALEKSIILDPSNAYALMSLAGVHMEKSNYNRAELLYQRASAYDPYREDAMLYLAKLAMDQENYQQALQVLHDILKEFPGRTDLTRNIESLENLVLLQSNN